MATFTATANTDTTIGYTLAGYANWRTGSSNGAIQGGHSIAPAGESYVGLIIFEGAGAALKGADISSITLSVTSGSSGTQSGNSTLTIHKSKYQALDKAVLGRNYVGDTLGTLTGRHYNNTTTYTLDATTNAALFAALKAYLAEGNSAIILYNGETSTSQAGSANYCVITSCTLTVTLSGGDTVPYCKDGKWIQCWSYYYNKDRWVKCARNRHNGKNWEKV